MTHGAGQIRALLDEHGITPSRALGQNFLVDPNTSRRIAAAAGAGSGDHVLEIGPGLGSLTLALVELGARVTAIELDRYLVPVLEAVVGDAPVDVVQADALDVDLGPLLGDGPARLAANLPYNVGTSILLRLLEDAPALTGGVALVQQEVAERLAAGPGDDAYGIPSVKLTWWATARVAGAVPATVFHPRPRVGSAFVTFERHDEPGDDDLRRATFALVDAGFGQRRKMLRRSLRDLVDDTAFVAADVDPTARAETLGLDAWIGLARAAERRPPPFWQDERNTL